MKTYPILIPMMLMAILLSACGGSVDITPTEIPSFAGVYTAAAASITAQAGLATPTLKLKPTTTPTIWASPTYGPNAPTIQSASVSYSTANDCYNAAYVSDVTIPDGTELAPGESFTKTWKLQNTGSCDWDADFVLTFETGTDMDGEDTTIDDAVLAGDSASLSISLVAPDSEGTYTGYWRLTTDSGDAFGQSVYVLIVVSDDAATATPTPTVTSTDETSAATSTPTPTSSPIPVDTDTPIPTDTPTSIATEISEATRTPEPDS